MPARRRRYTLGDNPVQRTKARLKLLGFRIVVAHGHAPSTQAWLAKSEDWKKLGLATFACWREDESDDRRFYARDRFVPHLDSRALAAVESVVEQLVVERRPAILDLMAGWDSHLPSGIRPSRATGLGLNRNEIRENPALGGGVLQDLNADARLPFADASFAMVLFDGRAVAARLRWRVCPRPLSRRAPGPGSAPGK